MTRHTKEMGLMRIPRRLEREAGLSLVEVACSMAVFSIVLLSVGMTLVSGIDQRRESFNTYLAMNALRNKVAEVQDTANQPQDLSTGVGIGAIFNRFNTASATVSTLKSGQITTTCYAQENAVPTKLGGLIDLNLDGDTADLLDNASAGTDLKLVPMEFSVSYVEDGVTVTKVVDRLITQTTN